MSYCALARRANGLFFYCFDDRKWRLADHPPVWRAVTDVVAEVNARLPLFQAEHVWWPYQHEFSEPDRGFNEALESSIIPALLRVRAGNELVPAGYYVLAVNNTDRELTYRVTVPGAADHLPVLAEGRIAAIDDGWLEDKFGPFDVHIYGPIQVIYD